MRSESTNSAKTVAPPGEYECIISRPVFQC